MIDIIGKEGKVIFSKELIKKRDKKLKVLLIASYLKINSPMNGNVGVSINILSEKIGYKPDNHENRINKKVISTIQYLIKNNDILIESQFARTKDNKWIKKEIDFDNIKSTDGFLIHINEDSKLFYPDDQYVMLTETEFITIVQSISKLDNEDLLNVYLNIKKFMSFDKNNLSCCYPSHTTLCRDCHISSTGVMNNIIDDLVNTGLLYKYNSGQFKDNNGNIKYANNFYALDKDTLKPEVCDETIRNYYSTQGIIINEFIRK